MKRLNGSPNKALMLTAIVLGGIITLQLFIGSTENTQVQPKAVYSVKQPHLPDKIDFAGESVPLHLFEVREALDHELITNTYWHSFILRILKRSHRVFPVIEPILKEHGVPDDFKYLAVIESSLNNHALSPAGATGTWQFMKATAKEYGLEVNTCIDERYNLVKSTVAACKYFNKAHDRYKNWTLVAAAYNRGTNGIDQQLELQKVDNYYDLLLNPETARYVYRIVAIKLIMQDHYKYGFYIKDSDKYPPLKTYSIQVDTTIDDLVDFAFEHDANYKTLKFFNPWLRKPYLTNKSGKAYTITLPEEAVRPCSNAKDSLY